MDEETPRIASLRTRGLGVMLFINCVTYIPHISGRIST